MNCDFYISLLSGHLDGTNTLAEGEQLQAHLGVCEECRTLLAVVQQNDALLKNCVAEPPADLTDRIMHQVRQNPKKRKKTAFYTSIAASALAAAAALAVFISGNVAPANNEELSVASAQELSVLADEALSHGAKKSVRSAVAVLVVHADSAGVDISGEKLDAENLPSSVTGAGYCPTGNETAAYSVPYAEMQRFAEQFREAYDLTLYANPDTTYTNAMIIFVD